MIRIISIWLILFTCQVAQTVSFAGEHGKGDRHSDRYEITKEHHDSDDHGRKGDKGSEGTGQAAAWLFVSANFMVVFSLMMKGANRFLPLTPQVKSSLKRFTQFQKKHLMRFHFLLNPLAFCVATVHFLWSSCRSSPLPEWGLFLVTAMVVLGLMVKFRVSPKSMRRGVYRVHTSSAGFSAVILVLLVGHLMVD